MEPAALDLDRFWAENRASLGKPFSTDKPRAPIALGFDDHWLAEELQIPSTVRYYQDEDYRLDCHRRANDRCELGIGLRPFSEKPAPPGPKRIEEVFGARTEIIEGGTPWLEPGVSTPAEFAALLDDLERLDDDGLADRMMGHLGTVDRVGGERQAWTRGPATVGTSVLGTMPWLYGFLDEPNLMERFYRVLADTMVRYQTIWSAATGQTITGVGILDDNCALLSPELYERYCFPVLERLFGEFASEPGAMRFQHSDSDMEHLLPILARLNLTGANFGPKIRAADIRAAMPNTEIHGQVAPFTVRNGTADQIVAEVRRDFDAVGADGGLVVTTAGSVAGGTSLDSLRVFMGAVDRWCRYDRATGSP